MTKIPLLFQKTKTVRNLKAYMDSSFNEVLHTTLNPDGPGAIRVHLIPPKTEENVKAKYGIEVVVTEFLNGKVNIESKAIDDITNTSEQINKILTILKNNEVTPIGIEDAINEIVTS